MPVLAEEWGSSPDAKVWTFKIRKGVQFHNGKEMTPADVLATMERHSGEDSKSGALGIMGGIDTIKVDGQNVVFTLKEANADLPFLMDDYHLMIQPNGGKDNPTEGVGTGPYKITVNEPGVRRRRREVRRLLASIAAMPTRSRSSSSTTPPPARPPCRAARCR